MRISELVTEPIKQVSTAYQQGRQQAAQGALGQISTAYQQGRQAAGGAKTADQLDKSTVKSTVQSVVNGQRVYEKEMQMLRTLAAQVKSGAWPTKQNAQQLSLAFKTAGQGQPLDDLQQSMLTKFLQEL